ncbi:MAG TPA: aspartate kinase [Clostridia bacterium]|nr:aspartate kinase [Clostridia bacterium]
MSLVVQKFGGSSVANAERIKNVAKRVIEYKSQGHQVITVVSAMGDSTDELIELARQINADPSPREMDMLLATGEQVSIALLAMAIEAEGYKVISLTGPQAGIKTDATHGKAKILDVDTKRLEAELSRGNIIIVAGFQGISEDNDITTLGRGGSDTTAVALAAALNADVCEIYTDVDGVYTSDPRVVPNAAKLPYVSYDEMLELASLGAVVLQPRAVEFAKLTNVKLHVRSSFNHTEGTIVQEVDENMERAMVVTGVACDKNVTKIAVFGVPDRPGIAYQLFNALAGENINVDMIIQSHEKDERNDISFTVTRDDKKHAVAIAKKVADEIGAEGVSFDDTVAKVSIVGAGMTTNPGVAAKMFEVLYKQNINIQMISTSEIKISCVIDEQQADSAVVALHEAFGLDQLNFIKP